MNRVNPENSVNRTRIARAIFAAAASMGMSDREHLEALTNQVIERMEQAQPLPGIERNEPRHLGQETHHDGFPVDGRQHGDAHIALGSVEREMESAVLGDLLLVECQVSVLLDGDDQRLVCVARHF